MDWWKRKKKRALLCKERGAMLLEDIIKCCDGKSNPIKFFPADLILKATNNFSDCNRVSEFNYFLWNWYSGKNDDDRMILINKYKYVDSYFYRDVAISSMVSGHKNFMKLAGCCIDYKYPFMVYYGGKEQYSLIDLEKIVSWKRRMKIAEDIATALAYLHTAFSTPFIYRNMDIENILIDENGVAKLSDFSRCISIPQGEKFVKVDSVMSESLYMEPDYLNNGIVSEKTDAYGFGMCMLKLFMGEKERYHQLEKKLLVDEMQDSYSIYGGEVTAEEHWSMRAFLLLSDKCVGYRGEVPTMVEVTKELKKIDRSLTSFS